MGDEQVLKLLTEIRDLQKQHLEHYKQALANQELSIANQKSAIETQKGVVKRTRLTLLMIGLVVVSLYALPLFWGTMSWGLRCLFRR